MMKPFGEIWSTLARGRRGVYPSIFRNRYEREGRTPDQQDAYAAARWMRDMDGRGALDGYFALPLSLAERAVADLEGWIFGVR